MTAHSTPFTVTAFSYKQFNKIVFLSFAFYLANRKWLILFTQDNNVNETAYLQLRLYIGC